LVRYDSIPQAYLSMCDANVIVIPPTTDVLAALAKFHVDASGIAMDIPKVPEYVVAVSVSKTAAPIARYISTSQLV
jgi:hypothetical protein